MSEPEENIDALQPEQSETVDLTINDGYDKRTKIVRELYTSEQLYVNNIETMIEGYLQPLRKSQALPPSVISGIFSNIEIIHKFHIHFLASLTERLSNWNSQSPLGETFLTLAPYLKLYSQYCANYDNSISLVQQHKKSTPEFAKFLIDTQNDAKFKGSYISSFLILPIQRIPRYELFLKEIVKITKHDHPDADNLRKSLFLVAALAESVNESCEKAENIQKIIEISKAINMDKLLKPARKYIREDEIELTSESYSGLSKCYLFNDLIVVTVKKRSKQYLSANLILCWIKDAESEDSVYLISTNITITMKFQNIDVKQSWVAKFNYSLKLAGESSKSRGTRDGYSLAEDGKSFKVVKSSSDNSENNAERKRSNKLIDWKMKRKEKSDDLRSSAPKHRKDRKHSESPKKLSKREEHQKFMRRSLSISNLKGRKDIDLSKSSEAVNEV